MIEIDVEIYETSNGRRPFEEWIKNIREINTRAKILTRVDRLKMGNFGDCKTLQDGVSELKIHYGFGIRIYYGKIGNKLILLLCGGDKGSQGKDIYTNYLKNRFLPVSAFPHIFRLHFGACLLTRPLVPAKKSEEPPC